MKKYTLGLGIDLDFGATQPTTIHDMTPGADSPVDIVFQAGASAIAVLSAVGWVQAEQNGMEMELQGSDNPFSGFAALEDVDGNTVEVGGATNSPVAMFQITIPEYLRLRNTSVTAGDGYGSAYLLSN